MIYVTGDMHGDFSRFKDSPLKKLKAGDTLLMHAGASGLASVVIPMAKAFGARGAEAFKENRQSEIQCSICGRLS